MSTKGKRRHPTPRVLEECIDLLVQFGINFEEGQVMNQYDKLALATLVALAEREGVEFSKPKLSGISGSQVVDQNSANTFFASWDNQAPDSLTKVDWTVNDVVVASEVAGQVTSALAFAFKDAGQFVLGCEATNKFGTTKKYLAVQVNQTSAPVTPPPTIHLQPPSEGETTPRYWTENASNVYLSYAGQPGTEVMLPEGATLMYWLEDTGTGGAFAPFEQGTYMTLHAIGPGGGTVVTFDPSNVNNVAA